MKLRDEINVRVNGSFSKSEKNVLRDTHFLQGKNHCFIKHGGKKIELLTITLKNMDIL